MCRAYRFAFPLVLLFVCACFSGCKGGGSTTVLQVTTTSLPNGAIGTSYSPALTAVGGTPGYTWSQSSGGAMPGGITFTSTGNFSGTPTATGTFGPYVFQVTASTGASASSAPLSVTITNAGLTIATSSLPQGTVNVAYSYALVASGGAPPYTWSQASGGAMPPGGVGVAAAAVATASGSAA